MPRFQKFLKHMHFKEEHHVMLLCTKEKVLYRSCLKLCVHTNFGC